MESALLDRLRSLHTDTIDARNGYREARDDAGKNGLESLFERMIALHEANAEELGRFLIASGAASDDKGSFMTNVHRGIIAIRSLFGGLDESVIPGLIDGEERIAGHYEEALKLADGEPDIVTLLAGQRTRILSAIAEMRGILGKS
jgi:uncharacterized protein (TIGR02284 family)